MSAKGVRIKCKGRVQGVFFRASTKEVADGLGLYGWVQNEPNGDVLIHAEGDEDLVDQLIVWCKSGPPMAVVTSVEQLEDQIQGFSEFTIRRF